MEKSKLIIIRNDRIITIKKKPDIAQCFIFAMALLAGILLPIVFEWIRAFAAFWVIFAICILTGIVEFVSVFFGKIVLDTDKREIKICNFYRKTYRFDDVKELKSFFKEGDVEGRLDTHKVLIIFTDGHQSGLRTTSKEQTQELIETLNSIISSQECL